MKAAIFQRAEYREWRGPIVPDSTQRPYAFSDRVPKDKIWVVLAVSAKDNFPSNEAVWLYAVPPQASNAQSIFSPIKIANQSNVPPLLAGVQLSKGGLSTSAEIISGTTPGQASVDLLPISFRNFVLPPDWMLAVLQDQNGGGGSGSLSFSAMIIALDLCEKIC